MGLKVTVALGVPSGETMWLGVDVTLRMALEMDVALGVGLGGPRDTFGEASGAGRECGLGNEAL